MANEEAIAASLKILGRAFAGDVDGERIELYRAALDDLTDSEIAKATILLVRTYDGVFIPPPAKIRAAVGADRVAPADVDAVIRRIKALSVYTPASGMIAPGVAVVREKLGEAAAQAYAAGGAERMFRDGDEVGSDIARREFATVFADWSKRTAAGLLGPGDHRQLDPRAQELISGVAHALPSPGAQQ
jgi:hypothetical protein